MHPDPVNKVSVVVLAAGTSTRFGPENKLLATLGDKRVLDHVLGQVIAARPFEVLVVTGLDEREVASRVEGLQVRCVHNPDYERGLGGSIATGVKACCHEADGFLLVLGDMVGLDSAHLTRLMSKLRTTREVVVSSCGEYAGSPVLFGAEFREPLELLSGEEGAASLWKGNPDRVTYCPMDPRCLSDIDTAGDLESWRGLEGQRNS